MRTARSRWKYKESICLLRNRAYKTPNGMEKSMTTQADKLIAGCGKSCGYRIDEEQLRKVLVHCGDLVNGKKHYGSECKSNAKTLAECLNEELSWLNTHGMFG